MEDKISIIGSCLLSEGGVSIGRIFNLPPEESIHHQWQNHSMMQTGEVQVICQDELIWVLHTSVFIFWYR